MGCGHFLVQAVDFITGQLLDFLNEFPHNAVHFALDRARQGIRQALAQQGATVDPARVRATDDCSRGTSSNNAFTALISTQWRSSLPRRAFGWKTWLPAPPGPCLDHHLRCGNALVGATLEDLRGPAGFDCVVGNPPYVRIQSLDKALVRYLEKRFESAGGKFDLYIPFLEHGTALLRKDGLLGMIVPNKFLTADYGAAFRGFAAAHRLLRQLVDFECERVFPGTGTYCCLVFLGRRTGHDHGLTRLLGASDREGHRRRAVPNALARPRGTSSREPTVHEAEYRSRRRRRAIFQGLITGADRLLIGDRDGDSIRFGTDSVEFDPEIFRPGLERPRRSPLWPAVLRSLRPLSAIGSLTDETELMAEAELAHAIRGVPLSVQTAARIGKTGKHIDDLSGVVRPLVPADYRALHVAKIVTQVLASRASFALDRQGDYTFVGGKRRRCMELFPTSPTKTGCGCCSAFSIPAVLTPRCRHAAHGFEEAISPTPAVSSRMPPFRSSEALDPGLEPCAANRHAGEGARTRRRTHDSARDRSSMRRSTSCTDVEPVDALLSRRRQPR